jgi:hypothetical protein
MANFVRIALVVILAGYFVLPVHAGDVAGWVDREVNAALAGPEHTFSAGCAVRDDLASAIDCEVNAALAVPKAKVELIR